MPSVAEPGKPRLFMHVGTHKTGTTSIQVMLRENRKQIGAAGLKVIVDPPGVGDGQITNCNSIAHAFIRQNLWTPSRISGALPAKFGDAGVIDYFLAQIQQGGFDNFVISAEVFCHLRTGEEGDLLAASLARLKCQVIPVIYLRNVRDWRDSWSAWLDHLDYVKVFRQEHADQFHLLDKGYFNPAAICDFWQSISPAAIFIDYDKAMMKQGSVIPSFLDILGLLAEFDSARYILNKRPLRKASC
jgi:hypothetical protein